jgi:hypothetical protein
LQLFWSGRAAQPNKYYDGTAELNWQLLLARSKQRKEQWGKAVVVVEEGAMG